MAEIPKDLKFLLFGRGPKWHAQCAFGLECIGVAALIIGIVGDAINKTPGLEPSNWILLAIALWVWSLFAWLCAYTAAKEG